MADNQWASVVNNNKQALENARSATDNAQTNFDQASQSLNAAELELNAARANNNTAAVSAASRKVLDASIAKSDSFQKLVQAQNNQSDASRALNLAQENASRVLQVEQAAPAVSYPVPNPASNTPNREPTASVPPPASTSGSRLPSTDSTTFTQQTNNQVLRAIGAPNAGEAFTQQTNQAVLASPALQAGPTVIDNSVLPAQFNQATNQGVLNAIGAPKPAESFVAQTNQGVLDAIRKTNATPDPVPTKVETYEDGTKAEFMPDGSIRYTKEDGTGGTTISTVPPSPTVADPNAGSSATASSVNAARRKAVADTFRQTRQREDWRVRLSLAAGASNYLYNAATEGDLLYPLKATDGVIFPYVPQVNISYKANYEVTDLVHSNYKQYFYKNSAVEEVTITADFTCQDTVEANYMLAVIHFFRSVTKMFYGQDGRNGGPPAGTPPPLCYLYGFGQYQFKDHPLLISNFSYSLPNNVDYIRAGSTQSYSGVNLQFQKPKPEVEQKPKGSGLLGKLTSFLRMRASNLQPGGISAEPAWVQLSNSAATYVPTKMQLTLTCIPIVTRLEISNDFSVDYYATGELYKSGIW
jgi:hypothetical protein